MLKRDTFQAGFITGLFLPVFIFLILYEVNDAWIIGNSNSAGLHMSFIGVMGVFVNIVPFTGYSRLRKGNAMRGIFAVTCIYAFVLLAMFIHDWM